VDDSPTSERPGSTPSSVDADRCRPQRRQLGPAVAVKDWEWRLGEEADDWPARLTGLPLVVGSYPGSWTGMRCYLHASGAVLSA
jgi:hypothetical protein